MSQLDFYFSTISPYTYLSLPRFRALAEARGLDVTWKPLDIMALYARTGGTPLGERPQARQDYRLADLARQAQRAGLPIHVQPAHFPTNAAPASYAIIAAQKVARETGEGDLPGLVEAVLSACWAEQKNIAEDAVITAALEQSVAEQRTRDDGAPSAWSRCVPR